MNHIQGCRSGEFNVAEISNTKPLRNPTQSVSPPYIPALHAQKSIATLFTLLYRHVTTTSIINTQPFHMSGEILSIQEPPYSLMAGLPMNVTVNLAAALPPNQLWIRTYAFYRNPNLNRSPCK
jgi:hypothetical protein